MAQLAIKGHATRGREVIEILEMLGGKQFESYKGIDINWCYTIIGGSIDWDYPSDKYKVFSLEEFLEKFPYKVGDKVTHNMGILMNVVHMCWDAECNVIRYNIQSPVDNNYKLKAMLAEHLQPYKEETMEKEIIYDEIDFNRCPCADKVQLILGDDFEIKVEDEKTFVVRKKNQYPKTYEECCEVLGIDTQFCMKYLPHGTFSYKDTIIYNLQELLICRDAHWKIAGEQMGLGKSWEPDWYDDEQGRHMIMVYENKLYKDMSIVGTNFILVFPTEEMRDAFYENFKELIETCKELL